MAFLERGQNAKFFFRSNDAYIKHLFPLPSKTFGIDLGGGWDQQRLCQILSFMLGFIVGQEKTHCRNWSFPQGKGIKVCFSQGDLWRAAGYSGCHFGTAAFSGPAEDGIGLEIPSVASK